ncbi:MAG: alkaline phosphatase family protein [Acidobacteriia bacterium]|nr:alkaline phosphatase family protein [Terriglobia bacterium]
MRSRRFLIPTLALIATLIVQIIWRSNVFTQTPAASHQPKLVIIIVIDQFRNDYLDRFRPYFVAGGFNLLLGGARFTTCRYDYAITGTGPGHASLLTGAYPNIHGIIGNDWFDRSLGRTVDCVDDPNTKIVDTDKGPADLPGESPHYLMNTTLGDELRMASGFQSKVIAISLKGRSAVFPGGHTANAAYWYHGSVGRFVSSTYYMPALPSWVAEFNAHSPAKEYCGKGWQALAETPNARGQLFSQVPPGSGEPCPSRRFLEWLDSTPFINEVELDFVLAAIRNEQLGQGATTDLLTVSLSVNDSVGHKFGPYSPQVTDTVLRTDRALADFFAKVDRTIGLANVWIALSADHGVAPTPQFVREHHLGLGRFSDEALRDSIEAALAEEADGARLVRAIEIPYVYLDQDALKRRQISPERAEMAVAQAARRVPGVKAAFTRTQLEKGQCTLDPLFKKAVNSFETGRSGDIFVILEPFAAPSDSDTSASHGSPWGYDAQVPMIFWGAPFRAGTYVDSVQPIDLVPTLAAALGLDQPSGAQGQPLSQALRQK